MKTILIFLILSVSCIKINAQNKFNIEMNIGVNNLIKETVNLEGMGEEFEVNNLSKKSYFFIQTIGSYNILNYLVTGVGAEFNEYGDDFSLISIIANAKLSYPNKTIRPFLNLSIGYGITTQDYNTGGLQYETGLGINIFLDKSFDLILMTNYKVININFDSDFNYYSGGKSKYDFFNLSAGLKFKF